MARPVKQGLEYFNLDVNFTSDIKIRKLRRQKDGRAMLVYLLLLTEIYRSGYYFTWDDDSSFIISEISGFEEDYISDVVQCCCDVGLFERTLFDEHKVLTSRSIQSRYFLSCSLTHRKVSSTQPYLLLDCPTQKDPSVSSDKTIVSSEETPVTSDKTRVLSEFSTQIKEKERKEKGKKENPPQTPPGELGGGAISDFSYIHNPGPSAIRGILSDAGVSDVDVWEYMRLMTAPELDEVKALSTAEAFAKLSAADKRKCPFYETIQVFQDMEQRGQLHPMPFDDFKVHKFIYFNTLGSDQSTINAMINDPRMFEECKKLIAEILRPKSNINQPAKFIISGLRKLQSVINHQRLKT